MPTPPHPGSSSADIPVGIEPAGLTRWLAAGIPALTAPLTFERLPGGRSNLTYRVQDASGRSVVLRRPPLGPVPRTAHDVLREARLLDAVHGSAPVPRVLARCDDTSVIGAPFIVVEFLPGTVLRGPEDAQALPGPRRARVGPALVEALVGLHGVAPESLGMGSLAARHDYTQRQLRRWDENWRRTRSRELPDLERAHARLTERIPEQRHTAIVHGDFRVDNCILDETGAVRGILDWELSTIGDPLADLGQLLVYWAEPGDDFAALHSPPTLVPDFATRDELKQWYVEATDVDPADIDYFVAFNWWRTACIVEDVYSRMLRGAMGRTDRTPESFGEQARSLAARALAEASRLSL